MQKLIFASNNKHKLEEIRSILYPDYSILSLNEMNIFSNPEETAENLEGNALIKARALFSISSSPCFADDTGLEVYALNNAPGVHSARYAHPTISDDLANRQKLLQMLKGKTKEYRKARFRTVIAFINQNGEEHLFEGIVEGEISEEEKGENGFGYDSIFIPNNECRTFAEMTDLEKNEISHRARALAQFRNFLIQKK